MENKEILKAIEEILDGIDRDEMDDGWWPTSTGVEFGKERLTKIRQLFEKDTD